MTRNEFYELVNLWCDAWAENPDPDLEAKCEEQLEDINVGLCDQLIGAGSVKEVADSLVAEGLIVES